MLWFGLGGQQSARRIIYRCSPRLDGEENRKKDAKLMGQDKGSLTEHQTK